MHPLTELDTYVTLELAQLVLLGEQNGPPMHLSISPLRTQFSLRGLGVGMTHREYPDWTPAGGHLHTHSHSHWHSHGHGRKNGSRLRHVRPMSDFALSLREGIMGQHLAAQRALGIVDEA